MLLLINICVYTFDDKIYSYCVHRLYIDLFGYFNECNCTI